MRKKKDTATLQIPLSEIFHPSPELLLEVVRELSPAYATDEEVFHLLRLAWENIYGKEEAPDKKTRKILKEIARVHADADGQTKSVIPLAVSNLLRATPQTKRIDTAEFKKLCHSARMARKRYPRTLAALIKFTQPSK